MAIRVRIITDDTDEMTYALYHLEQLPGFARETPTQGRKGQWLCYGNLRVPFPRQARIQEPPHGR